MQRNFADVLELRIETALAADALVELSASIERLYQAFSAYELKPELDRCMLCVYEEDELRIHSKPLPQLMPDELEKYGRKAMSTWGDEDDFRHFLPRLLQFYPFIGTGTLDPETIFSKLDYAHWEQWPESERRAVVDYFHALWKVVLHSIEPTPWTYAENFLCALAQALDSIAPFLTYWQHCDDAIAIRNLSAFIYMNCESLSETASRNTGFWESKPQQWKQVVSWVKNRDMLDYFASRAPDAHHLEEDFGEILDGARRCLGSELDSGNTSA